MNYEKCIHYDFDAENTGEGWVGSHGCNKKGECDVVVEGADCSVFEEDINDQIKAYRDRRAIGDAISKDYQDQANGNFR